MWGHTIQGMTADVCAVKFWVGSALTEEQFEAERWLFYPNHINNLEAFSPWLDAGYWTKDFSPGEANTWSIFAGSSPTTSPYMPPVTISPPTYFFPTPFGFNAKADLSGDANSVYEEFTWMVDAYNKPLTTAYDFLAAKMATRMNPITLQDDGGSFTDETEDAKSDVSDSVDILPAVPAVADAAYFGDEETGFQTLDINVTTAAADVTTIVWEYYNGSWTSLAGISDGTTGFSTTGTNTVSWMLPTDWAATAINGVTAFWVRARVSAIGASPTGPKGQLVQIDPIWEQVREWGENQDAAKQMLYLGPDGFYTERSVARTEGVWIAKRGAGATDYFTSDDGTQVSPPAQVTLELNGVVEGSQCAIYDSNDNELMNTVADATGIVTEQYLYAGDQTVDIYVRKSSAPTKYFPFISSGTITSAGLTVTVIQVEDAIADSA